MYLPRRCRNTIVLRACLLQHSFKRVVNYLDTKRNYVSSISKGSDLIKQNTWFQRHKRSLVNQIPLCTLYLRCEKSLRFHDLSKLNVLIWCHRKYLCVFHGLSMCIIIGACAQVYDCIMSYRIFIIQRISSLIRNEWMSCIIKFWFKESKNFYFGNKSCSIAFIIFKLQLPLKNFSGGM